jgi:hypothetical protein
MKGSGAKLLLYAWLTLFLLNAASPALCAAFVRADVCPVVNMAAMRATHRMPPGGCPLAKHRQSTSPNCCEVRVQDLGQNWHKQQTVSVASIAPVALLSNPSIDVSIPRAPPVSRLEEASAKLLERDVGTNQPRAPPIVCV